MGKTSEYVSFWNADMKVTEVLSASAPAYFKVTSLLQFLKKDYNLERFDDGTYIVRFNNGDFLRFR